MYTSDLQKQVDKAYKALQSAEKQYSICLRTASDDGECGLLQEQVEHAEQVYNALLRRLDRVAEEGQ